MPAPEHIVAAFLAGIAIGLTLWGIRRELTTPNPIDAALDEALDLGLPIREWDEHVTAALEWLTPLRPDPAEWDEYADAAVILAADARGDFAAWTAELEGDES